MAILIASAMQGEKLANSTTYNELQIYVRGQDDGIFAWPIPLFPNFAEFVDTLSELKQPILRDEKQ